MGVLGGNRAAPPVAASAAACSQLRSAYHDCFNRWYAEFSKGQWHKEECTSEFNKYRSCLEEHLEDKHLRKILLESQNSIGFPDSISHGDVSSKTN